MKRVKLASAYLLTLLSIGAGIAATNKIRKRFQDQSPVKSDIQVASDIDLFYATDRVEKSIFGRKYFGGGRSQEMKFGRFTKTLYEPQEVSDGTFEYGAFAHQTAQGELIDTIGQILKPRTDKRLVVFVPGYGEKFEKSMRRGCLMAAATKLPLVVFSWPSAGNFMAYSIDECNAEWSAAHLAELLVSLKMQLPDAQVTVIGFSLGARVATWALQHLGAHGKLKNGSSACLEHLILCSADMDPDTFATYAEVMAGGSEHTHVLASSIDVRLKISSLLHGRSRLGDLSFHRPSIHQTPLARVRTIDFTALDPARMGHSIPHELLSKIINNEPLPEGLGALDEGILEAEVT